MRYRVTWVMDDYDVLRDALDSEVSEYPNARVVSVTWQPERPGPKNLPLRAGYTIVFERP